MDGVMILTHPDSSGRLLMQAVGRGVTTFVEKPVAVNAEEIEAANQVALHKRIAVQVGYNRRHQPFYNEFKQSVDALASPRHIAVRFWRAGREESGFFLDTLVHPLELLFGAFGPLRVAGAKIFPAVEGAPLDRGWRVDLVSTLDPATTVEIDIRPATGMLVESYHALGRRHGCLLHFPYATKNGATAVFEQHAGELTHRLQVNVAPGDRVVSCYYGGFLGQAAQFVRLCAGLPCQPLCTLEGAASVLRLYKQIVVSPTHPLEA
jgi:predicted dehydrogenase